MGARPRGCSGCQGGVLRVPEDAPCRSLGFLGRRVGALGMWEPPGDARSTEPLSGCFWVRIRRDLGGFRPPGLPK